MFSAIKKALQKRGRCLSVCIFLLSGGAGLQPASAQNINTPNKTGPLGTQVNTVSGNLFIPRKDINIIARGTDINISFYYNSFNYDKNTGFGNGWSFMYGMSYRLDSTDAVVITWGDGREETYKPSGSNFTAPAGIFNKLTQYASGKYLLQTKYGIKYYFDNSAVKRLTRIEDPNSNALNFSYTDTLLTNISSTAGQTLSLAYNAGNLISITDTMASPTRVYNYAYDAGNNLITVTDPMSHPMKFKYLVNGPLSAITDKNGNTVDVIYYTDYSVSELVGCNTRKSFSYDTATHTTTVTDYVPTGSNQITTYNYTINNDIAWLTSINGNCCGYNMKFEFDANGNEVKQTDANGNVYTYTYDSRGNVLTATDALNHTSTYTYSADYSRVTGFTDANGYNYVVSYDNNGNILHAFAPDNTGVQASYTPNGDLVSLTDANGNVYTFTYDGNGNLSQVAGPLNHDLGLSFNARGNLLSVTDAKGNISTARYDALDRMTALTDALNHTTAATYDANSNMIAATDQNGHTRSYAYDASDRLITITDPLGNQLHNEYDAMNNLIRYKDQLGHTSTFTYDNRNHVSNFTDAEGNTSSYNYDASGNMVSTTYPAGNTFNFTYDKLNRPVSVSDIKGAISSFTYDNNGNVTSYTNGTGSVISLTYDNLNRVIRTTDAMGNYRAFSYDSNDNLLSVKDRNGHTSTYTYDARNRVKSNIDNNGNVVKATYDVTGNLATITDQNNNVTVYSYDGLNRITAATYADGRSVRLTYDNKGNMISGYLTDGSVINWQYDAMDRRTVKILPNNNTFNYSYDAAGRLVSAANSAGTIAVTYDVLNRVTSETFNGHTTAYSYNTRVRTQTITYPDGSSITRNMDERQRITSIVKGGSTIAAMQYNNADQLLQTSYGNGLNTARQYDFSNRINSISTSSSIQNLSYSYDNEDNITSIGRPQASEQFTYDANDRLTGYTKGASLQKSYVYDKVGNRITASLNGLSTTYGVNNLNQYTSLNNNSLNINFTYDNNGSLTYDGKFTKTYDAEGKLVSETSSAGTFTYQYDAIGRRVQKTLNGRTYNYFYAGLSQIEQRDGSSDTVLAETVWGKSLMPVMGVSGSKAYYYHVNHLNTVEAITTAGGALAEQYGYDDYGNTTVFDGSGNALSSSAYNNRFGYTGQEYDPENGTYHFHYRNYSPATGSFNQRDPVGYADEMGMYQYVHNNPAKYQDILGLQPCPPPVTYPKGQDYLDAASNGVNGYNFAVKGTILFKDTRLINFMEEGERLLYLDNNSVKGLQLLSQAEKGTEGLLNLENSFAKYSKGLGAWSNRLTAVDNVAKLYNFAQTYNDPNATTNDITKSAAGVGLSYLGYTPIGAGYNLLDYGVEKATGKSITNSADYAGTFYGNLWASYWYNIPMDYSDPNEKKDPPCPPNNNNGGTQKQRPPGSGKPGTKGKTNVKRPEDPNEIIGPEGVNAPKWVSISAVMPYTINYENSAAASAPAKTVRIEYPIDPKQDANTFSLGSFGFNSLTFPVPPNTASLYERVSALDSLGLYVDVTAGLDVINHKVFWTFQAIDPVTLLPPSDPLTGFLLLQDSSKPTSGHAYVNFFIKPLTTDITGDTTHAIASIIFDVNDRIPTNVAKNTIDAAAPVSHMSNLPSTTNSKFIHLTWSAADDANGSGVGSFTLYASQNGGSYTILGSGITGVDTTITGVSGNSYTFFVLATDKAGNTEALRPDAPQTTFVDYTNPTPLPVTWIYFKAANQGIDNLLNWATASEQNTRAFEVERSVDGRNFTVIGTVAAAGASTNTTTYSYTDKNATALNVNIVYYRLKQTDKDGKYVYSTVVVVNMPLTVTGPIVKAYPNPFRQTLNVMIAGMPGTGKDDVVEIYSVDGRLLYQKKVGQRLANELISLNDLPDLKAGSYLLKATLNGKIYSFKLVKQ